MSEVGFLLNRMMANVRKARDNHEREKILFKDKALTSSATCPIEWGNYSMGSTHFHPAQAGSIPSEG